ncbi:MAG TPA: dihydrodipicolinate synthase family protein [Candidatus Hydrogenedentes bacterium]|nr:dihydrodipicolinate synthase family protein [Candidatus Hydrogenedentota bacterium]
MDVFEALRRGMVIPASPLALTAARRMDERRQRALWRYYAAAGAGGVAIGVHTTQFALREAGMYPALLALAADEFARLDARRDTPLVRIAGLCGRTEQALVEADCAREQGFHAGLLSPAAFKDAPLEAALDHCRRVAQIIPIMGFYLQPAVGGRILPYAFWREFADIENVVAIKVAPFNRYHTLEVVQAVADAGRDDIALYTGNDDAILTDLLTPFVCQTPHGADTRHFVGGLLGHWAVWTKTAVELHRQCRDAVLTGTVPTLLLTRAVEVTDCNAAFFDAANGFKGCIAGLHEVLRRQGLLEGAWCLDPEETLSPGQAEEINRVYRAYPHLNDDVFIAEHLDAWM